jgi:hypothetical protein
MVSNLPVVALGELINVRDAPGIKVTIPSLVYSTDKVRIMTIRVHTVFKGKGLVAPHSTAEALVIPYGGEVVFSTDSEYYPEIKLGEQRIIFLDRAREGKDDNPEETRVGEVRGIAIHYPGKRFHAYAGSLAAEPEILSVVKRYVEVNSIRDSERREQELLSFSMSLIEDPKTPELFALCSAIDLRNIVAFARKSAVERLTERQIEKLIAIATDRTRPKGLRNQIRLTLEAVHKYAGRRINVEPLLQVIASSQDDPEVRKWFIYSLERMNTPEVRDGFKKILERSPRTPEDQIVWEELRHSKILREEP